MIILIPLGGIGERFKKNGYKEPKALIKVLGKPILYYLLDNLNLLNIDFVYIPYNQEYSNYRLEDNLIKDYPHIHFKFLKLEKNTGGAAETIKIALDNLSINDCPILCVDGDNFYSTDIISLWNGKNKVVTFNNNNDSTLYSYIQLDNNKIADIVEKQKISDYACSGAYGFESYKLLQKYSCKVVENNIKQNGEYYTSTVIKEMLLDNIIFYNELIDVNNWTCLGTPIQVKQFCNNFPKYSCINNDNKIKKMRICFDLDNTLVTYPEIKDDYTSVKPIQKNIDFLHYLKSFGHIIIIYTARRMKTYSGNVGKILYDVGKITFDTLERFNIHFDEIYFGKPYADIYIDDLALNCYDDLEKNLGFYMEKITPRDFNEIKSSSIETYTKHSDNLSGEIYYYNNIPIKIKDLFPILIDYDSNNTWYTMEKIQGLTLTSLYTSELLTGELLLNVMNSIKRIHNTTKCEDTETIDMNIYDNYVNKLKSRYLSYDYSRFHNSENVYNTLIHKLTEYEKNNKGVKSMIHGDPVMTNIIINKYDKIKFIDMRGILGNTLTIYGDSLYDWGKLYQSLLGYDSILQNKIVSEKYKNDMITIFEKRFIEMFSNEYLEYLKIITYSLLFTLIPLHNNDKCYEYYNLIKI